ncbi:MAG: response regulator [Gammaproteobacteria bacterium]|nr:response regulator [Gammaproteobacteria bacterium]
MATVLVVDDEESVRDMVTKMIEPAGYDVIEAGNGAEACDACKEAPVDLIITDIVMPEKNGIDLIMDVKKEFPDIPVIAISGGGGITGRYDYLEIAKLVGAKNILKKPFSMKELRSAVGNILNNEER